ncbi:MAG: hypothetical protein GY771_15890 [bacterium]|nr:hypothetical protein [bacterium]
MKRVICGVVIFTALLWSFGCEDIPGDIPGAWDLILESDFNLVKISRGPNSAVYVFDEHPAWLRLFSLTEGELNLEYEPTLCDHFSSDSLRGDNYFFIAYGGGDYYLFELADGNWTSYETPAEMNTPVSIECVGPGEVYVTTYERVENDNFVFEVYYFDHGNWQIRADFPEDVFRIRKSPAGTLYGFAQGPDSEGIDRLSLYVSYDNGETWEHESIELPGYYILKKVLGIGKYPAPVFYGENLYFATIINYADADLSLWSVIKRSLDINDNPIYDVLLAFPMLSPSSQDITGIAFNGIDQGIAVGYYTTFVSGGDGVWRKELDAPGFINGGVIVNPDGGFLGLSSAGGRDIYYHP